MANSLTPVPARRPIPIAPTVERWRAMTPSEREALLEEVNTALSDPLILMSEGRPHKKAKSKAIDMLGLHFRAMGRHIYLAEEMAVLYPGRESFSPDVLAVLDVEEPENDERMAWVVADEGKGLDWVLEVLHAGDPKKDLVDNVERYANLGIPEYFIYDRRRQRLFGYRLAPSGRYQPILPQAGLYRSNVLGIDLAIVNGSLRFYQGAAELYDTEHLINRLQSMIENLEVRASEAEARVEMVTQEAVRTAQEMARAAREEAVRAAQEAEKRVQVGLRRGLLLLLSARGIACSKDVLEKIDACSDSNQLQAWMERAAKLNSAEELFEE